MTRVRKTLSREWALRDSDQRNAPVKNADAHQKPPDSPESPVHAHAERSWMLQSGESGEIGSSGTP